MATEDTGSSSQRQELVVLYMPQGLMTAQEEQNELQVIFKKCQAASSDEFELIQSLEESVVLQNKGGCLQSIKQRWKNVRQKRQRRLKRRRGSDGSNQDASVSSQGSSPRNQCLEAPATWKPQFS